MNQQDYKILAKLSRDTFKSNSCHDIKKHVHVVCYTNTYAVFIDYKMEVYHHFNSTIEFIWLSADINTREYTSTWSFWRCPGLK